MKCPFCSDYMEEGVIQSPQVLSLQDGKHFFNVPFLRKGAIILSKFSLLRGSAVQAFCCRKCEKIVIDYIRGSCDLNL